jgi:hypothetical protein
MGKHIIQIPSKDGSVYIYDADSKTLRKICDVTGPGDIPEDVCETLRILNLKVSTVKA